VTPIDMHRWKARQTVILAMHAPNTFIDVASRACHLKIANPRPSQGAST